MASCVQKPRLAMMLVVSIGWWRFYDSCMGLFGHGRGLVRSRACFLGVIVAHLGRGFFPIFVPDLRAMN